MTTLDGRQGAEEPFGVGLIGSSATSRFVCERLSLRSDLRLVATWSEEEQDEDRPLSHAGSSPAECRRHATLFDVTQDPAVQFVHFAGGSQADWMRQALAATKSIVVESPQSLSLDELKQLARDAAACRQTAAVYGPRRWEADFLQARSALEGGRLGKLLRVRYSVHDYRLPNETFPLGVDRELGWPVLDQLLVLLDERPCRRFDWRHFPSDTDRSDGFVGRFDFADDVSAVVEVQTRSLLSYRSGWMLEGTAGACRNGRLYTRTLDGEIIDEPLPTPRESSDPFFDALASGLRGNANDLPTVSDAIRVEVLLASLPASGMMVHGKSGTNATNGTNDRRDLSVP